MDNKTSRFKVLKARTFGRLKHRREVREQKQRSRFLVVFFCVLLFFGLSVALYLFQNLIPHTFVDKGTIVSPNSVTSKSEDFKKALLDNGVQFETLTYATQSPTLIVKLPQDAYAYLNTSSSASSQAKLLANILARLSIQEKDKKVKYIDLRFEKAIVKF